MAYLCSGTQGTTLTFALPTSVTLTRDVGGVIALSEWINVDSPGVTHSTCTMSNAAASFSDSFRWYNTLQDSGYKYDGFTVYKTGLEGIGVAIQTRAFWGDGPTYTAWTDGLGASVKFSSPATSASAWIKIGGQAKIILVKYGRAPGGKIDAGNLFGLYISGDTDAWYGKGGYDRKYALPAITVTARTCKTPDITVPLGDHKISEFASVGSRTTPVKFDLQINDCPAGMASVKYGFNVNAGTAYTASAGLLGLISTSTAKGVKVKLMNGTGTSATEFDRWYTLTQYNAAVGGSYKVPLSAAFERTGDVSPGTAKAEAIIAMYYE